MNIIALKMLRQLARSKIEDCAEIAKAILSGESTIEEGLKYEGKFIQAVLRGNRPEALRLANFMNREALESEGTTQTMTATEKKIVKMYRAMTRETTKAIIHENKAKEHRANAQRCSQERDRLIMQNTQPQE